MTSKTEKIKLMKFMKKQKKKAFVTKKEFEILFTRESIIKTEYLSLEEVYPDANN